VGMIRVSSAITSARPYRRVSALGLLTRHLSPTVCICIIIDAALGVTKCIIWIVIRSF
ncbi:hypothetical protein BGY98DRAFT_999244, partial [Russula aff. rugulosa BPL654]